MRDRLERARVVALPVRDNSYSGATTVLLQAMALGKPVVVTRTAAIATGYGLVDGENVRLVAPGDAAAFGRAVVELLRDERHAASARRAGAGDRGVETHLGALRRPACRPGGCRRADEVAEVSAAPAGGQPDGRSHNG